MKKKRLGGIFDKGAIVMIRQDFADMQDVLKLNLYRLFQPFLSVCEMALLYQQFFAK
jgi:hypothetical protein